MKIFINIILLVFISTFGMMYAQRSVVNKGVDQYKKGEFADAEANFKKGVEEDSKNFAANFNLGDALYKQQRYDDAIKSYSSALAEAKGNVEKAKVYHNIGNSLLKDKKIKESIGAYKNSLMLNPNDNETKYNLSYALSLLKNQKNNKNNKNDKNQKNKQKNQNQKEQQNKQKQNQQNQNKPEQNKTTQQDQTKQQQKNKISKQEAERILQALKNNEKDLQKQLRKMKGQPVKTDKDW
jgi:Ca-activated chloride channel homolog